MTDLPLRILLVEDAPNDAELLRRGLQRVAPHFTVEHAERLDAALVLLASGGFAGKGLAGFIRKPYRPRAWRGRSARPWKTTRPS